jgi:hypothetical protein
MSNFDAIRVTLDSVDIGLKKARKDGSPESHRALVEAVQKLADTVRQLARNPEEAK